MERTKFEDDKFDYIESDIDKIKMKSGMYISYIGARGALHLSKELIQNAIDECENKKSPARNIYISLDLMSDRLTVEDDGRGIPEKDVSLDILCTKLQSGSKFTREQGGKSSGENGIGLTATNALSSYFSIASYRDKHLHQVIYENGVKKEDIVKDKCKKEHGTIVSFSPSQVYLGKSAKIDKKMLLDWIDDISYFLPNSCKIVIDIFNGLDRVDTKKYKARPFTDLLTEHASGDRTTPIFHLKNNVKMEEEVRNIIHDEHGKTKEIVSKVKRDLDIEFAFQYSTTVEPYTASFCNFIKTGSGGVHINAMREAVWRFLMKKTMDSLTEKEKEKFTILKVDIEEGMNFIAWLSTDMQMNLVGQTKDAVGNDEMYDPIKKLATKALEKYFDENKDKLNSLIKLIKLNCKARLEASKVKSAVIKENKERFSEHEYDNFTPCNNKGKEYKEIIVCEGKSAKGSIVNGRDPDTQAVLGVRGVGANALKRSLPEILENAEWRELIELLGCNVGAKFDITKCKYNKIIIMTDSDIDGSNITSIMCTFFVTVLPELVEAGMVYKAVPPLYRLNDSKNKFARDKREYVKLYQGSIIKNYKLTPISFGTTPFTKEQFKEFIYDTQSYLADLEYTTKSFGEKLHTFFVERVAAYISMYYPDANLDELFEKNKFVVDFLDMIQKKYPEIKLSGKKRLAGPIFGYSFQNIRIDNRFKKKIQILAKVYQKYGYEFYVEEKDQKKRMMSVGEFLTETLKYRIKIDERFKGLGENTSKELWDTALNPENRILIQLTMTDRERDRAIFDTLHGQSTEDKNARKAMMAEYIIDRDDLDN